jgi:nitrite reductase/ring-hydroxylating ferredoxin subunit
VGATSDFEHGIPRMITIGENEVGVIRWGERYFALRNHCPDQGGPLCAGPVRLPLAAGLTGDDFQLELEEGRPVIACPWHHYEFELETGREIRGTRRAVTYEVEVKDRRVLIRTGARGA